MKDTAQQIAQMVADAGGTAYFVGGTVRDELLGRDSKDIDIEVFGVPQSTLETILASFGDVNLVGKSFGVYKVGDLDISIPRTETKTGEGHRGFTVEPNPFLSVEDAMRRRDFTINAIYKNVLTGEIVDHFNGVRHIREGILTVVDPKTFVDDSLRVLRAAQFVSRLGFYVGNGLDIMLMREMDLSDLPSERVWGEMEKLLLGDYVKRGLETLDTTGALKKLFPELDTLRHVEQDEFWHPEGDVWTHTKMVVDVASRISRDLPKAERLTVMLASLFHDLGKATTTERVDGRVKAHGHSEAGVPIALELLKRLNVHTIDGFDVRGNVLTLVERHLIPAQLHRTPDVRDSVFRRLSTKVNVKLLAYVCKADVLGRGGEVDADCVDWFNSRLEGLNIVDQSIQPILQGRHLIELGFTPSKEFGVILSDVFEKQLDGAVTTLEEAIAEVRVKYP